MKKFYLVIVLAGAVFFMCALVQLFEIRFARGDVYPAYSTLRSDPLGAKAFYESLARLDQVSVSRNERALDQFSAPNRTTLFYIGAAGLSATEKEILNLERFVKNGGRLVITFYPQSIETYLVEHEEKKKTPSPSPTPEETSLVKYLSTRDLARRWGFKLHADSKLVGGFSENSKTPTIDPKISWHSALHFQDSAADWKNIYVASDLPVVIERSLDQGTIVLAADSYFLSNEAMRRERHPGFLVWLVGPGKNIVFDETHLGIEENPGVSTLMRRYHLGGLLAGLLVLALLAVWKNAARLVPANQSSDAGDEIVAGKESFAGFVNLLRRNIGPSELLSTCVQEWTKSLPRNGAKSKTRIDRVKEIIQESPRDIVTAYQQISRAIHETKWKTKPANSSTP